MSSYLLDMVCQAHAYPRMGWRWKKSDLPIHVYCQDLWEHKYRVHYQKICDHFLISLFQLLFCARAPCMSEKAMEAISEIDDWFVLENETYIRIYGSTKPPHVLPKFVPDKLVLQEVAYHTLVHGVGASLSKYKKLSWPPLPFYVGSYSFKNSKEAHAEAEALATFHFGEGIFHRYDPRKVVSQHCKLCKHKWPYESETWRDEDIYKKAHNYDEVILRRGGSSTTKENSKVEQEKEAKEAEAKEKDEEEAAAKETTEKERLEKDHEALWKKKAEEEVVAKAVAEKERLEKEPEALRHKKSKEEAAAKATTEKERLEKEAEALRHKEAAEEEIAIAEAEKKRKGEEEQEQRRLRAEQEAKLKQEEEERKKKEEEKKAQEEIDDTDPMDTDLPEASSIPLTGGHFPLGELGLGGLTSFKASRVADLDSFIFDRAQGKIVQ
jgi:DNA segregation ATPase FtsK/SpoIIIE-like protein